MFRQDFSFKKALKNAFSQMGTVISTAHQQAQLQAAQAQKLQQAQLQQQQQLLYQQPVAVRLDEAQLQSIMLQLETTPYAKSADVLLSQQQMTRVFKWFLEQAWHAQDLRTFANLKQGMLPLGLGFNLGWLRHLHKDVFDSFIHGYNPDLTYVQCAPNGSLFLLTGKGYGLCYSISANSQTTLNRYKNDFERFAATAQGQTLIKKYGLRYKDITFNSQTGNLTLIFD